MPKREDFQKLFPNIALGIVQGRFYVGDTLYKRKLATFEELGFDVHGDPPRGESARDARRRESLLTGRYAEILKEIEAAEAQRNPPDGIPLSEAVQRWLAGVELRTSPKNLAMATDTLRRFQQAVGDIPVAHLRREHVETFIRFLRTPHAVQYPREPKPRTVTLAPVSINSHLRMLKVFLRSAAEDDWIVKAPKVEFLPELDAEEVLPTWDDVRALLTRLINLRQTARSPRERRAYRNWLRFIVMDATTGMRRNELLFRKLADFDLVRGSILVQENEVFKPKERKPKRIPLLAWHVHWLQAEFARAAEEDAPIGSSRGRRQDVWFLDNGAGRPAYKDGGTLTHKINEQWEAVAPGHGWKGIHDLRKLYITTLSQRGADEFDIGAAVGHSQNTTTRIYIADREVQGRRAANLLGNPLESILGRPVQEAEPAKQS